MLPYQVLIPMANNPAGSVGSSPVPIDPAVDSRKRAEATGQWAEAIGRTIGTLITGCSSFEVFMAQLRLQRGRDRFAEHCGRSSECSRLGCAQAIGSRFNTVTMSLAINSPIYTGRGHNLERQIWKNVQKMALSSDIEHMCNAWWHLCPAFRAELQSMANCTREISPTTIAVLGPDECKARVVDAIKTTFKASFSAAQWTATYVIPTSTDSEPNSVPTNYQRRSI